MWALLLTATFPCFSQDAEVVRAQQTLLRQQIQAPVSADVSSAARLAIRSLKDELVRATDAALLRLPEPISVHLVESALHTALPGENAGQDEFRTSAALADKATPKQPVHVAGLYGSGLRIQVQQPRPGLLLVQEGFVLPCGDDNLLLAYAHHDTGWQRVLRWQSADYDHMDEAFGDSFAALSLTAQSDGFPLLLVKHGRPWCTSTMSTLSLTVLKPPIGGEEAPKVLWRSEQAYRRFDLDYLSKASATLDGFGVSASFPSLDGGQIGKETTRYYQVTPTQVVRTGPFGERAAAALDEWFQLAWTQTSRFADPADRRDLEGIHGRVYKEKGKNPKPGEVTYLTVRSCNDSPTRRQVEIDLRPGDAKMQELAYVLYDPAQDRPFRFASAYSDPACLGSDELHNNGARSGSQ